MRMFSVLFCGWLLVGVLGCGPSGGTTTLVDDGEAEFVDESDPLPDHDS